MTNSVRKWRDKLCLTQQEAADKLGVTARHYQSYESGDYAPPPAVRKVMRAIDMGVELEPWPISKADEEKRQIRRPRKERAH